MRQIETILQEQKMVQFRLNVTRSILSEPITHIRIDQYTLQDAEVNKAITEVLKSKELKLVEELNELNLKVKAINLLLGEGKYKRKKAVNKILGD